MKNKLLYVTLTLVFVITKMSYAQYDPEALTILKAMSDTYKKLASFQADLTLSLINQGEGIEETMKGMITVKKNKFRLTWDNQWIISDEKNIWTYLPTVQEVTISDVDLEDNDMNPTKLYTLYEEGYKYLYLEDKMKGKTPCQVIDLVPEDKEAQYFKIRMYISKVDKKLKSWTFFDKEGNRFKYTIENFQDNVKLEESFFSFDPNKYPDVEVVDLR